MIDLYYYTSPNVRKVLIALEELRLPYEIKWTDITAGDQFSDEYLQVNPNGKVPAVVVHDGRHLPVRVDLEVLVAELVAGGDVGPFDLVRQPQFLERDQHLPDVGAGVVVEVDHGRRSDAELGLHPVEIGHQVGLGLHVAGAWPGVRLKGNVLHRRVHRRVQRAEPVAGEVLVLAQVVRQSVDVGAEEDLDHFRGAA